MDQQLRVARATLRNEVMPAVVSYGIASVEAAFSGDGGVFTITGVQLRDANGLRVSRLVVPPSLVERMEVSALAFLPNERQNGAGVVTLDFSVGKVIVRYATTERDAEEQERQCEI